jgi:hypothetical protein
MCDSKELLVAFLYDELDPSAKRTFEAHVASCAECRDEIAELRATRGQIALWTPPEPDLGFRLIRGAAAPPPPPPPPRFRIAPAWGLAAAALLVLAVGAAIANLDVRYDAAGLSVRTGWQHVGDAPSAAPQNAAGGVANVDWKAQAEVLDRRLRDLERAVGARPQPSAVQSASATNLSDAEVLQQVREIVGQSETRQQRMVTARLAELTRTFDAQRRIDLATIDQGMMRLQNTSGVEMRRTRELFNRVYQATASYQQK